jgi:PIN domain nuclease of toxin-antitoxin system
MNGYLLDTHTLLWMQDDSKLLSHSARKVLGDSQANLHVSIVSFWEIVIKSSLRKLKIDYSMDDLSLACNANRIKVLPIELCVLKQLQTLPYFHRDPFDRLIASTAINYQLFLITRDPNIANYDVHTLW